MGKKTKHLVGSCDGALMEQGAEPHVEQDWGLESGLFKMDGGAVPDVFAARVLDQSTIPHVLAHGSLVGTLTRAATDRPSPRRSANNGN